MPRTTHFRSVLLVSISLAALTACSSGGGTQHAKSTAPMPPITEMDAAMNAPAPQPLPLSEGDTLTPVMAHAPDNETVEQRMARLENSVNALRGDYEKIMPAFASLNTTNERIQTLLTEIEKETGKKIAPPPAQAIKAQPKQEKVPVTGVLPPAGTVIGETMVVKSSDVPVKKTVTEAVIMETESVDADAPPLSAFKEQPTVEQARAEAARQAALSASKVAPAAATETPKQAATAIGPNSVKGVRIGEHGSKTRLVFDLAGNNKPDFEYDLNNGEKILTVDMPASDWAGAQTGKPKSPMIDGWSVEKGANGGSIVAVQLKKDARVISTEFLKAEGKDSARLVIDIAPQS